MLDYTVPAMEVSLPEVRQTFETNFVSVISMCKTFLPLLIQAKGTIVQVGSIAGVRLLSDIHLGIHRLTALGHSVRVWVGLQCLQGSFAFLE